MKTLFITTFFLLITWLTGCQVRQKPVEGIVVRFPEFTNALAITSGPKEHFFASYYGINSWSADQRYATVLETDIKYRIPDENDPAVLGLVDMESFKFIPLAETTAWNFQQGCMAHWLGTSPDSLIIYNDRIDGKFVSVILNVFTGEKRMIPYPVSAVSPTGQEAVSINFARIRLTRPDYGYGGNGQDPHKEQDYPSNDGLFLIDLKTGTSTLLVSIAQVRELVPAVDPGALEYFNHTLFSRDGSKIFWLSRGHANGIRNTTAFTVNRDGTNLQRCFPDHWEGSHFDWLNGQDLMVTAKYLGKAYEHILFTVGENNYQRLGNGLLDFDAHGTFSPDGKWMSTDTYPDGELHEQKIFLMDMKTQAVLSLGRFFEPPEYTGGWRCDLHARWSPGGNMLGFNSTKTGSRQAYIIRFKQ